MGCDCCTPLKAVQQSEAGGCVPFAVTYVRHGVRLLNAALQSTSAPVGAGDSSVGGGLCWAGGGVARTGLGTGAMAGAGAGAPSRLAHLLTSVGTLQSVDMSKARVTLPSPELGSWNCWSSAHRHTGEVACTLLKAVQQVVLGAGSLPCT